MYKVWYSSSSVNIFLLFLTLAEGSEERETREEKREEER